MPSNIDCHIENFAGNDPHQFSLRLLNLIVQAAQDALAGLGMIVLHKIKRDSGFGETPFLVTLQEKSPRILKHFWLNQQNIGEGRRDEFQNWFLVLSFVNEIVNTIESNLVKRAYYSRV